MVLTTAVVTVNCSPGNDVVEINKPFENFYVNISYILIFILGAIITFAIRKADLEAPQVQAFIDTLRSEAFHKKLDEMGGYGYHQAGKIVEI